ncbi:MAG: hypothetical protein IT381_33010 [Deltaproteobacteria bacterium]|nr:hypothetical protein [Deltaproteobacteria bacterium]
MHAETRARHEDCSFHDDGQCQAGDPENCPPTIKYRTRERARFEGAWHVLEARRDELNGWRHYLGGAPVHCGESIELQAMEAKYDDYGEYSAYKPDGIVVRYEASLRGDTPVVTLYAFIKGHLFTKPLESWMRFRWPKQS